MTIKNNSPVTEPNRARILSMIDNDNAVLVSTEAAIAVAVESETLYRSEVEKAKHVFDDATSTHRLFAENLETLKMSAQRILESIAKNKAMLSAVRLLPGEIIEEIALNVRDSLLFSGDPTSTPPYPTQFMLGLLAICSRWRQVLIAAPRLWQILPLRPSRQSSINLVARLRPLTRGTPLHWWLYVRSTTKEFDDDMETFQGIHSDCESEDGQLDLLTLVFEEPHGQPLNLRLRASTVITLFAGVTPRPAGEPFPDSCGLIVTLHPGALPALKSIELHGIFLEPRNMHIFPRLRTFIAYGIPMPVHGSPRTSAEMVKAFLERCPQLSKVKVEHCLYRDTDCIVHYPPKSRPKLCLAITELEVDLIGMNNVLTPLAYSTEYEFQEPIRKLTLTNHLYRLPSTARGGYMLAAWKRTRVVYDALTVKRFLNMIHGVKQLYLRTGGGAILDSQVPFTFQFRTDNLAPLKEVEELILQCASGCPDEIRVTLEGLHQDPDLFPRLRKILFESCRTMTPVWGPLVQVVCARKSIESVEFVDCAVVPGACPDLHDLLAARRA